MKTQMQRFMENIIELGISDEGLQSLYQVVEILNPFIKSKEDVLLGYVVASIRSAMICYTDKNYNRMPTKEESDELWKMLIDKLDEIKSKIEYKFMK